MPYVRNQYTLPARRIGACLMSHLAADNLASPV